MANLIRSGRPGSAWTSYDLESYNIQISNVDEQTFFESEDDILEPPESLKGFLTHLTSIDARAAGDEETAALLSLMEKAPSCTDGLVSEFASRMLKNLGYEGKGRLVIIHGALWFEGGGIRQKARTSVCVVDRINVMLVVQKDKCASRGDFHGNEPQLIAEAIGAFASNQRGAHLRGSTPVTDLVIPGILMVGTTPVFYKIPITEDLYAAVRANTYPPEQTSVDRYLPVPENIDVRTAMSDLCMRRKVVRCYQAFRKFLAIAEGVHP